jgi:hypothetical protein
MVVSPFVLGQNFEIQPFEILYHRYSFASSTPRHIISKIEIGLKMKTASLLFWIFVGLIAYRPWSLSLSVERLLTIVRPTTNIVLLFII